MSAHRPDLAPSRPTIHLSTPSGWLNDPNGLCVRGDVWHAFYQHDPGADVHGTIHWGHATSSDLLHWRHHPIALSPDELGAIYSGSVVFDQTDTAGFGAGAMVAIYTNHLDRVERQSVAYSHDDGMTWTKFTGNPVLESDETDFRDPKVFRHVGADGPAWVMCLAVGHRIEFYRSTDLLTWRLAGTYSNELPTQGPWECPDLIRLVSERPGDRWLLVFGAVGLGPHGHSGTCGVLGDFDGHSFSSDRSPHRLDEGPDFYAPQSFTNAETPTVMAWLNSWRYSRTHPSDGWRGILSLPRQLSIADGDDGPVVMSAPAVDLPSHGTRHAQHRWKSDPAHALAVLADGDVELLVEDARGASVATLEISAGMVRLRRHQDVTSHYAETYEAARTTTGRHQIVVDHGTIEVFAGGGGVTMTALVFPGKEWSVRVGGDADLHVVTASAAGRAR